jgi:hypothetical protein
LARDKVWHQHGIGGVKRGMMKGTGGSSDDCDANQRPNVEVASQQKNERDK